PLAMWNRHECTHGAMARERKTQIRRRFRA
ncbi:4-hydroxyproline epimerase, partial [Vibrio parahaemolyticus EKP-028]